MYFTQEDYKKIQLWLQKNAVKDTEFNSGTLPLNGGETITLVQNKQNVKVFLKDFTTQLALLGSPDFINISDKFGENYISLLQAIRLIPYRSRKTGQVITFLDESNKWRIYQFQGERINQWDNPTLWIDLIKAISTEGTVIPDEEDITEVKQGDNIVLKFKDKAYNKGNYSGLGRVFLRKNITIVDSPIGEKIPTNLLTQKMISKENTVYIIQYDYSLNGGTITIPEGCILDFQGGSISNGRVISLGTKLVLPKFDNVFITGKVYNLYNEEISHYKWDIIEHRSCKLFTYILWSSEDWDKDMLGIEKAYRLGITNFYWIVSLSYKAATGTISVTENPHSLKDIVNWIKKYNIHVPYLKIHFSTDDNSVYNSANFANEYKIAVEKLITTITGYGISFEKIWVVNELPNISGIPYNTDTFYIWKPVLEELKSFIEDNNSECWLSLASNMRALYSSNVINQSLNLYPRISCLDYNYKGYIYNRNLAESIANMINSYINNSPNNTSFIISETGCNGGAHTLAKPAAWGEVSSIGGYSVDVIEIYFKAIIDAINRSQGIDSMCLWFIESFRNNPSWNTDKMYNILNSIR